MSEIGQVSVFLAAAGALLFLPCLASPASAREFAARFPRSRAWGWLLTAVDLAWVVCIVRGASLGRFEPFRPLIYAAAPVALVLMGLFMDELLAPRALGGLMLLVPAPVLAAARWHGSGFRLVIVALCYALVAAGIALVLSPFEFRKFMSFWVRSDRTCRAWGALGLGVSALLAALGLVAL
jgi:hypothetical protein